MQEEKKKEDKGSKVEERKGSRNCKELVSLLTLISVDAVNSQSTSAQAVGCRDTALMSVRLKTGNITNCFVHKDNTS